MRQTIDSLSSKNRSIGIRLKECGRDGGKRGSLSAAAWCSVVVKVRFVAKFSDNGTLQAKQDSFRLARQPTGIDQMTKAVVDLLGDLSLVNCAGSHFYLI